ncbi:hypothetical protein TNCV_2239231 [Trichonephila clavipes]|nr:hypothetical protein TNCV_2239231 [Trichonephila clavipes]
MSAVQRNLEKKLYQTDAHILQEFGQAFETVCFDIFLPKGSIFAGFHSCAASHKPLNTKFNRTARLRWCNELRKRTMHEWKQALWIDESRFHLY